MRSHLPRARHQSRPLGYRALETVDIGCRGSGGHSYHRRIQTIRADRTITARWLPAHCDASGSQICLNSAPVSHMPYKCPAVSGGATEPGQQLWHRIETD